MCGVDGGFPVTRLNRMVEDFLSKLVGFQVSSGGVSASLVACLEGCKVLMLALLLVYLYAWLHASFCLQACWDVYMCVCLYPLRPVQVLKAESDATRKG